MIGKITITKEKFLDEEKSVINREAIFDYEYIVCNTKNDKIEKIVNRENVNSAINTMLKVCEMDPDIFKEDIDLANYLTENKIDVLEAAEYVEIENDINKIKEYIENNPILKSKKIILPNIYDLNYKSILEIEKLFKDCSYIYIKVPGNQMPINIDTFKATLKVIDKIVFDTRKLDLSPIEQVMYVYDIVKDKEYHEESDTENKYLSRDVSSSLLGDKIVCSGYSNIFKTILDRLDIKNEVYFVTNHQRNIAYIKDEKYDIDGIYYFDVTGDSKINFKGNEHFNKYLYFAKTKYQIDSYYKTEDETLPCFYDLLSSDDYFDFIESEGMQGATPNLIYTINKMAKLIEGKALIPYIPLIKKDKKCTNEQVRNILTGKFLNPEDVKLDKNAIEEKIEGYLETFDKPLKASIMLNILCNIRKKQWYLNPEKYPFSEEDLAKAVLYSKWSFKEEDDEIDIIALIKNAVRKRPTYEIIKEAQDYIEKEEIDRDIERVKTAKVLRRVLESKKQN